MGKKMTSPVRGVSLAHQVVVKPENYCQEWEESEAEGCVRG